ncbi:MAG TPA: DUF1573 domain-containing protein [Flavitalea sp.]|nr:DUF1573 domain-containing protein [Flavitalea sp.]
MKSLYLSFLLFSVAPFTGFGQKLGKSPSEVLDVKETSFDFGKIPQGRPVTHNFEILNKSNKPLMIDNVEASCGCTTPEWSQEPVAPGATSLIKVGFNASSEGKFQKTITIYYGDKVKGLKITGEVYPMPTTSAPPNASLSTLK